MSISQFDFQELSFQGVFLINPFMTKDERGEACKDFSYEEFKDAGILFHPTEVIIIKSNRGVLRGLHFQKKLGQGKVIRGIDGNIWAVIVDINPESGNFGKWISIQINKGFSAYIPGTYAIGTLALENSTMLCIYDNKYVAEDCSGIIWNDKDLHVEWPLNLVKGEPILSEKDFALQTFAEYTEKVRCAKIRYREIVRTC